MNKWPDLANLDPTLVARYDKRGPRYTSYPTAPHFSSDVDRDALDRRICATSAAAEPLPLSLYVHIPFCRQRCHFCYFRVYTDNDARRVRRYIDAVVAEITDAGGEVVDERKKRRQMAIDRKRQSQMAKQMAMAISRYLMNFWYCEAPSIRPMPSHRPCRSCRRTSRVTS